MRTNVEFCMNQAQALDDHINNEMKNAFRAGVILRTAHVTFDWDYEGKRTFQIANIVDKDNLSIPSIPVFVNQHEYNVYLEACDIATGTGWAVHMANGCEQEYQQNMRELFATRDPHHDMRSLQDEVYWYKHHVDEKMVTDMFQKQVQVLEAVRGNVVPFMDAEG